MDKIYLYLFYFFRFLVRVLPDFLLHPILNGIYHLIYFFDAKHKKIIKTNLDFAFGEVLSKKEKEEITKKCYKNLVYFLADFIKNQGISKEELAKKVTFKNKNILEDAIKNNQKIILITAHYGNWELISLALSAFDKPITGVGRALDTKRLDTILKKNREQFNIEVLNKNGAFRGMMRALKQGRLLGLLVDQNTSEKDGVLIDFFGKKARQTHSTSLLARKMDAVIIPAFITTDDYKNYTVTFYDKITPIKTEDIDNDILKTTQEQANIIEKVIRQKPDEWFWFHKKWKNQYEEIYK